MESEPSTATLPSIADADAAAVAAAAAAAAVVAVEAAATTPTAAAADTTTTAAATAPMADAKDRRELLWLSQYQLLRAKVLYTTMTTEGVHRATPLVDLPIPFHLATGELGSEEAVAVLMSTATADMYHALPPTSLGPLTELGVEDFMDVPLAPQGDELAPKNPSIVQIRHAARVTVENKEKLQLVQQKQKEDRTLAIEQARKKGK